MASIISAGTTSGTALNMTADTTGALQLATNSGTTAVTIDTSQNVLIGATSASGFDSGADNLIVGGGSGSNGLTIYAGSAGVGTINFANGNSGSSIYAGGINYNHSNNRMSFYTTDGTGRMFIDSSGNVLVGTTSQLFSSCRFSMSSSVNGAGFITTAGASYCPVIVQRTASTGDFQQFVNQSGSAAIGSISTSNNTSVAYNTSSDYRLKENIAPMTGALDTVALLKPVTYTWKQNGSDGQGFIAHELAEVVPDCVSGEKDAVETYTDEDGIEQTRPKYQGVDTSFLVATLTAAIQEQQTIINDLKARIETLESK